MTAPIQQKAPLPVSKKCALNAGALNQHAPPTLPSTAWVHDRCDWKPPKGLVKRWPSILLPNETLLDYLIQKKPLAIKSGRRGLPMLMMDETLARSSGGKCM